MERVFELHDEREANTFAVRSRLTPEAQIEEINYVSRSLDDMSTGTHQPAIANKAPYLDNERSRYYKYFEIMFT